MGMAISTGTDAVRPPPSVAVISNRTFLRPCLRSAGSLTVMSPVLEFREKGPVSPLAEYSMMVP